MVYPISKLVLWPFFRLFIKRIEGIENIPEKPCIFVANHSSYLDAGFIIMLMAWHRNMKVCTFATKKYFTGWFWDILFNHFGAIRINGSLEKAVNALQESGMLIFPEGARTWDGQVRESKHTGLGVLALETNAKVVPIALNTYNWWNRFQTIPNFRRTIKIIIGKPKTFSGKINKQRARKIVNEMMKEVKRLARISHT